MNYKHIIWDWNGTIVDDSWLSLESLNSILSDFNIPEISQNYYRENFSFPVADFYRKIGFDASDEVFKKVGVTFMQRFNAKRFQCSLQKGVLDFIKELNTLGVKQSILSAYRQDFLKETVQYFKIDQYMSQIVGLDDIYANSKLNLGLKYIESVTAPKSEILYIGDTNHDFETARAMGVECRLIALGHQTKDVLEKTGAKTYQSYADLKRDLLA